MNIFEKFFCFCTALVIWLVWSLIFAYFGMLLWNYCMPAMFGLSTVDYLHMLGFMVMLRIILPLGAK